MRKRSGDIMQKIRKNLLTELFLCFVFLIGFVLLLFYFDHLYTITLAVLGIILSVFFGTLFGSLHYRISKFESSAKDTSQYLADSIGIIETFTRLYLFFTMIMLPVAFLTGMVSGYFEVIATTGANGFSWLTGMAVYTTCFLLWSGLVFVATKWWLKKFYLNHLNRLKDVLYELGKS
ncbi:MAG: hypothetical protein H7Y27_04100 [Gemmatimonadaceae bacterium]|nr:hypothetical protein [Chitinophagaceae bacterium]